MKQINYKISLSDLFYLANEYSPITKKNHNNILDDFAKRDLNEVKAHNKKLEEKISNSDKENLLDRFSTKEWVEATTISQLFTPNKKLEELLIFSWVERTILALEKLENIRNKQKESWRNFVSKFTKKTIESEINYFTWKIKDIPLDSPENIKILHTLLAVKEVLSWKSTVSESLVMHWVFGLLTEHKETVKIYHLSDTIKDWDTAKQRIKVHYNILQTKYWIDNFEVEFHWSGFSRSFQTWAQVIQLIWQSSEIAHKKHRLKTCPKLYFMVNNASRSKHKNKEKAQGSECLWARVEEKSTWVLHEIIWVDHEVFSVFKDNIKELYIIEWMPWDEHYSDLSKWTQFRSLHNFPYVQFLNAVSTGSPAWFRVKKVDVDDIIPNMVLASNEVMLVDPDHYWNWKSLSVHKDWIFGICKDLWAEMDVDTLIWTFYHPDTEEKICEIEFIPTEFLWKHTGEKCAWNWSSRWLDWKVFIELWISAKLPTDRVTEIVEAPVWTRVFFRKK